jgi:hypothetical protein
MGGRGAGRTREAQGAQLRAGGVEVPRRCSRIPAGGGIPLGRARAYLRGHLDALDRPGGRESQGHPQRDAASAGAKVDKLGAGRNAADGKEQLGVGGR